MHSRIIAEVQQRMLPYLTNEQLLHLGEAIESSLSGYTLLEGKPEKEDVPDLIESFVTAKRLEGCSEKTLRYYRITLERALHEIAKPPNRILTEDLRNYLIQYQTERKISKVTVDNIRRIPSSFFAWLEDEDLIVKSPVRRIHKIRTSKTVKEVYSDETLEKMRDACETARDLAIIDLLASTGMRVGELVALDRDDVDFVERECVVFGKGAKQRTVYFDARTKLHLQDYLDLRQDDAPPLFVSLKQPAKRLSVGAVELRLRNIGNKINVPRVYPHKFRRTMATNAIDKGMPIELVQHILGHTKIDATLHYAMVKQQNVKLAHRKFIG